MSYDWKNGWGGLNAVNFGPGFGGGGSFGGGGFTGGVDPLAALPGGDDMPIYSTETLTGGGQYEGAMPTFDAGTGSAGGLTGMNKAQLALGGLQTIGQLWGAWQSAKLAKKSFKFNRNMANRNLENQTKTYNTAMDDRVGNRQAMYAGSANAMTPAMAQAYLDKNRLSTRKVG